MVNRGTASGRTPARSKTSAGQHSKESTLLDTNHQLDFLLAKLRRNSLSQYLKKWVKMKMRFTSLPLQNSPSERAFLKAEPVELLMHLMWVLLGKERNKGYFWVFGLSNSPNDLPLNLHILGNKAPNGRSRNRQAGFGHAKFEMISGYSYGGTKMRPTSWLKTLKTIKQV